jgi:2'-5' RNA ligase
MASNLVIVAIPAADDDVWTVSSEKAPHLTILFLGDAMSNPNVSKIIDHVKDRSRDLEPFSLLVDHRGTLGPDEADVLFFTKDIPWQLIDFRETLKYNQEIAMAYNAIPQRQDWKPHLTLGYPETPAHPDDWDPMGVQYVTFDKVAVWFGDSEGAEFPLTENPKPQWREDSPRIAEWADTVGDILAHHGVKGMKWGVRKATGRSEKQVFKRQVKSIPGAAKVNLVLRDKVNAKLGELNNRPEFKGKDLKKDKTLRKQYNEELKKMHTQAYKEAVTEAHGTSSSGKYTAVVKAGHVHIYHTERVKHADEVAVFALTFDANGFVTKIETTETAQGALMVDEILEHHGVRGMRWGVRRKNIGTPNEVTVSVDKGKLKAKGGEGHAPSEEAKAAAATKQKAKASGVHSLSNEEIQAAVTRMNLESNFKQATAKTKQTVPGQKFVLNLLKNTGNAQVQRVVNDQATKAVKKHIGV